jgi:four helix bundle protein
LSLASVCWRGARLQQADGVAESPCLAIEINTASIQFPKARAALASQMRRSAESIATNIVEGCGRMSQRELARFLQISAASSSELEYQLRLAHDYGLLDTRAWDRMSERTIEVRRMLIGLIRKVRNDAAVSAET